MDRLDVYTKSTKAWFKDPQEGYIVATLSQSTRTPKQIQMKFTSDSDGKEIVFEEDLLKLEQNGFESLPFLKNPPRLEGADDLTTLSYLHEAAVLHSVKIRLLTKLTTGNLDDLILGIPLTF